jgi:hypothetical protein
MTVRELLTALIANRTTALDQDVVLAVPGAEAHEPHTTIVEVKVTHDAVYLIPGEL